MLYCDVTGVALAFGWSHDLKRLALALSLLETQVLDLVFGNQVLNPKYGQIQRQGGSQKFTAGPDVTMGAQYVGDLF